MTTERYGEYTTGLADRIRTAVPRAKIVLVVPNFSEIPGRVEQFPAVYVFWLDTKTLSAKKTDGTLRKVIDVQLGICVLAKSASVKVGDGRTGVRGSDQIATLVADAIEPHTLVLSNGDVLDPCVITDETPLDFENGFDAIAFEVSINAYTIRR